MSRTVTCVAMVTQQSVIQTDVQRMCGACVYTAESELRPAKCASQYIWQLFVVVCLSFEVTRGGWERAQVEAWYPHVLNTWPSCIHTLHFFHPLPVTPFVPFCQVLHQSCSLQWGCLMAYIAALPSLIPVWLCVILTPHVNGLTLEV